MELMLSELIIQSLKHLIPFLVKEVSLGGLPTVLLQPNFFSGFDSHPIPCFREPSPFKVDLPQFDDAEQYMLKHVLESVTPQPFIPYDVYEIRSFIDDYLNVSNIDKYLAELTRPDYVDRVAPFFDKFRLVSIADEDEWPADDLLIAQWIMSQDAAAIPEERTAPISWKFVIWVLIIEVCVGMAIVDLYGQESSSDNKPNVDYDGSFDSL
jgi:hypothetical protein